MTATQIESLRLVASEMNERGLPNLGDDALIYSGAATWEQWENHVPMILVNQWKNLSGEARLAVYITAKSFTAWRAR